MKPSSSTVGRASMGPFGNRATPPGRARKPGMLLSAGLSRPGRPPPTRVQTALPRAHKAKPNGWPLLGLAPQGKLEPKPGSASRCLRVRSPTTALLEPGPYLVRHWGDGARGAIREQGEGRSTPAPPPPNFAAMVLSSWPRGSGPITDNFLPGHRWWWCPMTRVRS